MLNFGLQFGRAGGKNTPNWWKIDTLNPDDILDAWDFGWSGHKDPDAQKIGFEHNRVWRVRSGNPSQRLGDGVYFGGGGSWDLASFNLDWSNVSVIIEFHTLTNNNNLDALFSHYRNDGSQFTLQNEWNTDLIRWSCGASGSDTLEVSGAMTDGVIGVSGVHLYKNGTLVGSVPESGEAMQDINFVLGAIQTDNNDNYQYMKGTIKKILIVKRRLTDAEQAEIYANITGTAIAYIDMDSDSKPDTVLAQNGGITVTEDNDSINIDLDGDMVADIVIPK
jgi:hypothetical protein